MATEEVFVSISEAAQEAEVLKYYQPTSSIPSDSTQLSSSPYGATLNSFALCAALRLNAQRCVISLFTRKWQYIIAEATRTRALSSPNDEICGELDQLRRGVTAHPRETGPCTQAFSFLSSPEKPEFLLFPDLALDIVYSKLPYVSGPRKRFYAAVPITSPSGIVIGTFAIFDDVPRDSIFMAEIRFMAAMAATTMQHLEICELKETIMRQNMNEIQTDCSQVSKTF